MSSPKEPFSGRLVPAKEEHRIEAVAFNILEDDAPPGQNALALALESAAYYVRENPDTRDKFLVAVEVQPEDDRSYGRSWVVGLAYRILERKNE